MREVGEGVGNMHGGSGSARKSLLFLVLLLLLLLLSGLLVAGVVGVGVGVWRVAGVVELVALWRRNRDLPYLAQIGFRRGGLLGGVVVSGFVAVEVVGVVVVAVVVLVVLGAAVVVLVVVDVLVVVVAVVVAAVGARAKYAASVGSQEGSGGNGNVGSKKAFTMACVVRVREIAAAFADALVVKVNLCLVRWVVVQMINDQNRIR